MLASDIERPSFTDGQYLDAADLTAAVEYAQVQQARHALGGHTWGVAAGLDLRETAAPGGTVDIHVLPGYAWDGYGRPIVVLSPYRIPEEKFGSFIFDPAIDSTGKGRLIPIWLGYCERPAIGNVYDRCAGTSAAGRVRETFRIEVGELSAGERISGINVAGRTLSEPSTALRQFDPDARLLFDESIPHQEYRSVSARSRWLIPIGFV